jgi:hypothetical protein
LTSTAARRRHPLYSRHCRQRSSLRPAGSGTCSRPTRARRPCTTTGGPCARARSPSTTTVTPYRARPPRRAATAAPFAVRRRRISHLLTRAAWHARRLVQPHAAARARLVPRVCDHARPCRTSSPSRLRLQRAGPLQGRCAARGAAGRLPYAHTAPPTALTVRRPRDGARTRTQHRAIDAAHTQGPPISRRSPSAV